MSTGTLSPGRAKIDKPTLRTDRYWVAPLATFVVFLAFIAYATFRAFQNNHYFASPYISPFYSPCISDNCVPMPGAGEVHVVGSWWSWSPALLVLIVPLGFRMTCYYYRKAYYRAFWQSPPACAVAEPHGKYSGETRFPLILQNSHRYFFVLAGLFNIILTWDAILGFRNADGQWGHMGLGTLVLTANAGLLWAYTASCHSCRHIMGGRLKHFSKHPLRYRAWGAVSKLNGRHMQLAWVSLFSVVIADLYVFLVSSNAFSDPRFF
ncbi:MAG TPA: hypothetical protein VGS97_17685 [Actinocrinis sp.]|uniref:hypothetical protein n=1 Tax=Actinocrinis sp. TaxID=1920516 RepID=UPI002DDD7136|nr:hypothetical protein [Actinocrinis sp.]HEV2345935.1 hypothetical protein [Actinocrinis sp.]